jgi:hypothetical protein
MQNLVVVTVENLHVIPHVSLLVYVCDIKEYNFFHVKNKPNDGCTEFFIYFQTVKTDANTLGLRKAICRSKVTLECH